MTERRAIGAMMALPLIASFVGTSLSLIALGDRLWTPTKEAASIVERLTRVETGLTAVKDRIDDLRSSIHTPQARRAQP